jgi:hypothetical protein
MAALTPCLRKFALTAHVTSSVGVLGAIAAFLAHQGRPPGSAGVAESSLSSARHRSRSQARAWPPAKREVVHSRGRSTRWHILIQRYSYTHVANPRSFEK